MKGFPKYLDGDVELSISPDGDDCYVLHSQVLATASEFFRAGLEEPWLSAKIAGSKIVNGKEISMKRYELEYDADIDTWVLVGKVQISSSEDRLRMAEESHVNRSAKQIAKSLNMPESLKDVQVTADGKPADFVCDAWRVIFTMLYHKDPVDISEQTCGTGKIELLMWQVALICRFHALAEALSGGIFSIVITPGLWPSGGSSFASLLGIASLIKHRHLWDVAFRRAIGSVSLSGIPECFAFLPDAETIIPLLQRGVLDMLEIVSDIDRKLMMMAVPTPNFATQHCVPLSLYTEVTSAVWRSCLVDKFLHRNEDTKQIAGVTPYIELFDGKLERFNEFHPLISLVNCQKTYLHDDKLKYLMSKMLARAGDTVRPLLAKPTLAKNCLSVQIFDHNPGYFQIVSAPTPPWVESSPSNSNSSPPST